jgi:hypothetical protein
MSDLARRDVARRSDHASEGTGLVAEGILIASPVPAHLRFMRARHR